jgi:hypothetical protein
MSRLARDHGFDGFDSDRGANATYEDTRFFELQTFMAMVGYGRHRLQLASSTDTGRIVAHTAIHISEL